jgi:nitrogen regulatory protein P-II 1
MKRIEMVIDPSALDRFTEAAKDLHLSDFDVTEVRRSLPSSIRERQRLYRGHEFVIDFVDRLKIDLMVADDVATQIARDLVDSVRPESLAVVRLDQAVVVTSQPAVRSSRIAAVPNPPAFVATN